MSLSVPGTYITRNGRKVELVSSESRQIKNGANNPETIAFYKGQLFKADGQSLDSEHEWIDTLRVGVLGEHVNINSNFQTASEYDLVQRTD